MNHTHPPRDNLSGHADDHNKIWETIGRLNKVDGWNLLIGMLAFLVGMVALLMEVIK